MDSGKVLTGIEGANLLIKDNEIRNYVWDKIYNKNLFDSRRFPDGKIFEDIYIMYDLFLAADKISISGNHYKYYYRIRENSITNQKKLKNQISRFNAIYTRYEHLQNNPHIDKNHLLFDFITSLVMLSTKYPLKLWSEIKKYKSVIMENQDTAGNCLLNKAHKLFLTLPYPVFILIFTRFTRFIYLLFDTIKNLFRIKHKGGGS